MAARVSIGRKRDAGAKASASVGILTVWPVALNHCARHTPHPPNVTEKQTLISLLPENADDFFKRGQNVVL